MDPSDRDMYRRSASHLTILGHVFGVTTIILLLIWLLHYRGGLNLDSDYASRVFNVHPFLMFSGFIFLAGEGMMAYKTVRAERRVQKFVHMGLNLSALVLGIIGVHAAFKFHDRVNISHMDSLHSWIGIATFCFFCLQWLVGFTMFLFPGGSTLARARALPWHMFGGRVLLYMAICTAETGLMEQATFLKLPNNNESRLINFIAIAILLFGIFVDLSITLGRYA